MERSGILKSTAMINHGMRYAPGERLGHLSGLYVWVASCNLTAANDSYSFIATIAVFLHMCAHSLFLAWCKLIVNFVRVLCLYIVYADSVDVPAYRISVVVTGSCSVLCCAVLDCLLGVDPAAVADLCSPLRR